MTLDVRPGLHVKDVCGEPAGIVVGVASDRFAVLHDDVTVWLPPDLVFTTDPATVTLQCNATSIARYAVPAPARIPSLHMAAGARVVQRPR